MDYGRIIRRALEITWRHKVLWIFGAVAALFSGGGGGGNGASNAIQYQLDRGDLGGLSRMLPFGVDPSEVIPIILAIIAALVVFAVALAIVGIVVRYTSLGALIGGVDEVERTERTSFGTSLNRGWRNLLPLFAIDLLIGIVGFVFALAVIVLAIAGAAFALIPAIALAEGAGNNVIAILWAVGVGLAVLLGIIAIGVALSALATLVRELSFRARVLEGQGVFAAIGTAFRLIRSRLKEVLLVWLLLVAISLALAILTIPLVVIGAVGLIGPVVAALAITEAAVVAFLIAIPLLLLFIIVAALVSGIYLTFESAVWTLAYRELRGEYLAPEAA